MAMMLMGTAMLYHVIERYFLKEFLLTLSNAAHLPEENDDSHSTDDDQEVTDGNLFDAHAVEQSPPAPPIQSIDGNNSDNSASGTATAASEDSRIIRNAGAMGQERKNCGRPPSRRGRRGRHARINQNLIREEEAASEDNSIIRNARAADQGRRSRGRPPSRRGRRGRLANQNLIREVEETTNTEKETVQEPIARVESIVNERININDETDTIAEGSERSVDQLIDPNEGNHVRNEERDIPEDEVARIDATFENEINEDEHDFDIPADDYDFLAEEEQNDLPYHPVLSGPISSENNRGVCCTCLNTIATHVPCGHLCICGDYEQQIEDYKCPLCREIYTYCIRVITT
ncbi:uncharacterized protein LOC120357010 [Solenopsis invicta]|uniref:uncharacterized protein LOC120357010 n=1 Tax=Solenopsis invicta TaxID=13686 RepID=UPI00193E8A12|nr:uncharacterized protein LOC120357010 [Solenopsis invicta]